MKTTALVLLVLLSGCATQKIQKTTSTKETPTVSTKSVVKQPAKVTSTDIVMLDHNFFKIAYNKKRRLPEYVTYDLTAEHLKAKSAERANKFIPDPMLKEKNLPFVVTSEYTKSGYDRGHMAPSADFAWSQEANDLTFVMSNMAPQTPNLNRDAWKRLEDQVRKWACGEGRVTVITGPVLTDNLPRMKSGLEIPQKFFKIIIDQTPPKKAISFIYTQEDRGEMMEKNMVPVNSVESMTGVAFMNDFPDLRNEKVRLPAASNEWKEARCD